MGDVPRILNMFALISFVVSLLSFVLVSDLMNKLNTVFIVCVGLISDPFDLTCVFPR